MDLKYFLKKTKAKQSLASARLGTPQSLYFHVDSGSTFKTFVDSLPRVKNNANIQIDAYIHNLLTFYC